MQSSICGRFAPTPSGRMHIGNLFCCLLAWLSARSQDGHVLLRIEDLDAARCQMGEFSKKIPLDLTWMGLDWDNPLDGNAFQKNRTLLYEQQFARLQKTGLLYPCFCSRAELHAASAPHASDGQPVYPGTCRTLSPAQRRMRAQEKAPAYRLCVPNVAVDFTDLLQGRVTQWLTKECGDFIIRRADGVFAYQFAVVVDDALMGVTQVVRGRDLLLSTPRQILLYQLLGFTPPKWLHLPLLLSPDGRRLSKRDGDIDTGRIQACASSEQLVGLLGWLAGLLSKPRAITPAELLPLFSPKKIPKDDIRLPENWMQLLQQI